MISEKYTDTYTEKKKGVERCEEYRTISLASHALRILTRIIQNRIQNKLKKY